MTRTYEIHAMHPTDGHEDVCEFEATDVGEALMMAEREYAGHANVILGIAPEDYAEAVTLGIAFNEADGLLVDAS